MNTDYAQNIKDDRDKFDTNKLISEPILTQYQRNLAYGSHMFSYVAVLFFANAMIYASRKNLLNSKNFFLMSLVGTIPAAYYTSKFLFGYDKLRKIDANDVNTYASAKYYEKHATQS